MFSTLILSCTILAATVAAQTYQSNKYPAGVHPSLCPHYPYCDNTVLAGFAHSAAGLHQSSAPGYPASLSPHACPNYPYCSHQIPAEAIHYRRSTPSYNQHQFAAASIQYPSYPVAAPVISSAAKYPSGVDPASCPNYPYCH